MKELLADETKRYFKADSSDKKIFKYIIDILLNVFFFFEVEKVWEVDQAVHKQGFFHLNWIRSTVWTKYMPNPWIFRKSWKPTFWYSSTLIFYVHGPMCECNACDNVSLEVFTSIKRHSLIPHLYKMKDSCNWPHLSLVHGVARELCPIKVVFPEFKVKECLNKRQSVNNPFPMSLV